MDESVSRLRWLVVELGLGGPWRSFAAGAALLTLMVTWWSSRSTGVDQRPLQPEDTFALDGFVPGGYAVFAFALGATAGVVLRRTLPAMAVTLAGSHRRRGVAVTSWIRYRTTSAQATTRPSR